jgi:hypothetical protein
MRHHALTGGLAVFWQVVLRIVADLHGGEPGPFALASIVGNPIRRKYMGRMLDRAGSRPGERVLELGPGGTLVAVDLELPMISAVEKKALEADVANVETHVASAHDLSLGGESVDLALLVTALFKIPDRHRELPEMVAVPGPCGVLSTTGDLPEPDCRPVGTTIGWAREAGSELAERLGHWFVHTFNCQRQGRSCTPHPGIATASPS